VAYLLTVPTLEQVKVAEARMREAQRALVAYTQRPQNEPEDTAKHRVLAEALRCATNEYVALVLALETK